MAHGSFVFCFKQHWGCPELKSTEFKVSRVILTTNYLQTAFICDTLWRSPIKWSILERNVHHKTINRSTIQKDKQFLKVPASDVMSERFLFLEFYLNFLDMGRRRFFKGGGKFQVSMDSPLGGFVDPPFFFGDAKTGCKRRQSVRLSLCHASVSLCS